MTFKNDSDEDFKDLKISIGENEFKFSNLKKGQQTRQITVKETYWFCETTAITQKDTLLFTGFCPVGETLITDGVLMVSYVIYPKNGEYRRLVASEVSYSGSAKNVGFPKITIKDEQYLIVKSCAPQVVIVFVQTQTPHSNEKKYSSLQSKAKGACKKA